MIAPLDRVQLALNVFLTTNGLIRLVMKDKKSETVLIIDATPKEKLKRIVQKEAKK